MAAEVREWGATAAAAVRHPVFVVALTVLVLNDQWWKAAWPGPVTGKLSDVAGVVVAAVLLSLVAVLTGVGHQSAAVGASLVVGALFVAMKTTTWGATTAESVWTLLNGGRNGVVVDPTDLVALLALPIVPRLLGSRRSAETTNTSRRVGRSIAVFVLGGAAIVATTATAACGIDPQVERIRHDGDWLLAVDGSGDPVAWSDDAGATWTDATGPNDPTVPTGRFGPDRDEPADACFGKDCWRAVDGRLVHRDGDNTSRVLEAGGDQRTGCDRASAGVRSVVAVTTDSGDRVVVASMGGQGIAVAPYDGNDLEDWKRVAIGGTSIPSGFGESWPPRGLWLAGSIVSLATAGAIGSAVGRARRRGGETIFSFFVGVVAFGLASVNLLGGILLALGLAEATGFRAFAGLALAVGYGLLVAVVRSLSGPKPAPAPDVVETA